MKRSEQAFVISMTGFLALSLSSCSSCSRNLSPGGRGAPANSAPAQFYTPPGAIFDVTYTPNTVRIDFLTVRKTLRSVSLDARVFVFDSSDPRIGELTQGKVMFLEKLGVRRILDVQTKGSQVVLLTEAASLTDFIQDGRIEFTAPINFGRTQAQAAPNWGKQEPLDTFLGFKS